MFGQVLQSTHREIQKSFGTPRPWIVIVLVGLVLGISGPFNTFDALPVAPRVVYWVLMVAITFVSGSIASEFALHFCVAKKSSIMTRYVLRAVAPIIPVVPLVFAINALAFSRTSFSSDEAWVILFYVAVIAIAVSTLSIVMSGKFNLIDDREIAGKVDAERVDFVPVPEMQRPSVLDRVELAKRGDLISLSVQDHYVEIVTQRGQSLVLMRLNDAMNETRGIEGLQIHRSHWVARSAVLNVIKRDGKPYVQLSDNRELPISRSYLPAVKNAGLMPR